MANECGFAVHLLSTSPNQETFGIEVEHHYGITTHALPADGDLKSAAYRLCREFHTFLTDDNHTWEHKPREGWSRIDVTKGKEAPRWLLAPSWMPDGPGAHWFSMNYRVATREGIRAEIADKLSWAERWDANAESQRDTIRGRKARSKYAGLATIARREAELVRSRWPEFDGSPRTGWQERMHEKQQAAA